MILIYSNKPDMGRKVVEAIGSEIKETYPNQKIVVINQLYFYNLNFQYPKKLKWSDYPYREEPIYKFNTTNWHNWRPCEISDKNTLIPITITTEEIKKVKTIIYADDPFSTNCHNFDLFIQHFFANKLLETPAIKAISLDKTELQKSWKERKDFYELFQSFVNQSIIKRFFNYNYNINSIGILGATLKSIGIDNNKHQISKYALQLLYELKELKNQKINSNSSCIKITEGKLVNLMSNWKGTGKYKRNNIYEGRLGSEMSVIDIIMSLINMNLVEKVKTSSQDEIQISQLGELFLSKLHKDCLDKDLPFRYCMWQNENVEVAKNKIREYLKVFFGKQKRKLNNDE